MSRSSTAMQTHFQAFPMLTGNLLSARMMVRLQPSMLGNCWHISKFGIQFLRSLYQSSCVFFAAMTNVITHISQAAMTPLRNMLRPFGNALALNFISTYSSIVFCMAMLANSSVWCSILNYTPSVHVPNITRKLEWHMLITLRHRWTSLMQPVLQTAVLLSRGSRTPRPWNQWNTQAPTTPPWNIMIWPIHYHHQDCR